MKNFLKPAALVAAILSAAFSGSLSAQVTAVQGGGAQPGANYVNLDGLTSGQTTSYTSGAMTISFAGNASAVTGNAFGASVPWLTGNNNVFFESPSSLPVGGQSDGTGYIQAGSTANSGAITFNFSSPQPYFGLLVGSVDQNNTLNFYSGPNGTGTLIETVTGTDIFTDAGLSSYGNTGLGGTAYVNVDAISDFESVVATTGTTTLEIDNVAYGVASRIVSDDGMTAGLLAGALVGLQALRRKLVR